VNVIGEIVMPVKRWWRLLQKTENIACVSVAARQSSPRRDRQIGHPVRRNASIQIVALQASEFVISQLLAGHRSIEMTQCYVDEDARGQRRLVALLELARATDGSNGSPLTTSDLQNRKGGITPPPKRHLIQCCEHTSRRQAKTLFIMRLFLSLLAGEPRPFSRNRTG
jgi:hypothetical protein